MITSPVHGAIVNSAATSLKSFILLRKLPFAASHRRRSSLSCRRSNLLQSQSGVLGKIAIKIIRVSDDSSGQLQDILGRLRREADVWSRLKHKNILPFFGVCEDLAGAPTPVLISPFYKSGHVGTYLRKHPNTNRKKCKNILVDKRALQILTSEAPKRGPSKTIVTTEILAQLQPGREDHDIDTVTNATWSVLTQWWSFEPQLRPPITEVLSELTAIFT
ncbi:hypothetical protein B0H13DRAFT_1900630 [Mycena leptocephala]|nr:hypothetical protein B0H13DRAFT_1900630 [Mycena leptocephala]